MIESQAGRQAPSAISRLLACAFVTLLATLQVAAADENEGSSPSASSRPGADGSTDQWRQSMSRSRLQASKQQQAALQAQQAAQIGARKLKDSGLTEVLQFTKYFHLVPSKVCSTPPLSQPWQDASAYLGPHGAQLRLYDLCWQV